MSQTNDETSVQTPPATYYTVNHQEVTSALDKVIASTVGGILVAVATCPFDVVTRRLQAQQSTFVHNTNPLLDGVTPQRFTSSFDAAVSIARSEGVFSLWRGLAPTLWMTVPATAFYFTFYQTLRGKIEQRAIVPDGTAPLIAGPVARSLTVLLSAPLEMTRTRIQARAASTTRGVDSTFNVLRDAVRTEGTRGLLRGVVPTLYRDVPFSALYWFLYEKSVRSFTTATSNNVPTLTTPSACARDDVAIAACGGGDSAVMNDEPVVEYNVPFAVHFGAGALAGMAAATLTHPFDVVKTRRQMLTQSTDSSASGSTSMFRIARELVKAEGVAGLSSGLAPRLAKVAPACAIMISCYEWFLGALARRNHAQTME